MYYSITNLLMNNCVKTTLPFMEENQSYYLQETADLHVYQHMYMTAKGIGMSSQLNKKTPH